MSDDGVAVAAIVEATAQACQDHLIALAIEESSRTGAEIAVAREAWAD
jgi:hypothetical protein